MSDIGVQPQPGPSEGFISLVPMQPTESFKGELIHIRGGPWQPPPMFGVSGTKVESGERVLIIANETPIELLAVHEQLEQVVIEQLHLDRFCSDWLMVHGARPYIHVTVDPDRSKAPDFSAVNGSGQRVGVDCVQFAIRSRRTANGQFAAIKRAIASSEPDRFRHLYGLLVYVWVQTSEEIKLPLRPPQRAALLNALESYRYDPDNGRTVGLEVTLKAPPLGIAETAEGWRFYATPLLASVPSNPLFYRMGFEMAFVFNSEHTPQSGWDDLYERVVDHDKDPIQELIVTVGGPDRNGYIHPAEEAVLELMLQDVRWSYAPKHLRSIYIHGWETGRILQLYPDVRVVSAGLFKGLVAPHQVLRHS